MPNRLKLLTAVLCAATCPHFSFAQAQPRSVALTFDDLPIAGTVDPAEAKSINLAILNSLDTHHAPAIGFVIGRRVQEIGEAQGKALLDQRTSRSYDLDNHTFSHQVSDAFTAEQFEHEIVEAEASFAPGLAKVGKSRKKRL